MPLEMKINSDNMNVVPFDKFERLCKVETHRVLNNGSKRMMHHSMLAYSQKMQDISTFRKGGIALARSDRLNFARTPSWLDSAQSSITSNSLSNTQATVSRKWATLHKLRKPNDSSFHSISDSVWNYKDTTLSSRSVNGHMRGAKTLSLRENRPRSRSVLDLVVRNHTDYQRSESPKSRPSSDQGTASPNQFGAISQVDFTKYKGRGFACPPDNYMLDNPALRGQTNVLTLPDISDTTGDITNMENNSSVQIVPFPAITELQAVPAKLHSNPLIPPPTKKLPIENKLRQGGQKTLFYKDSNKETTVLAKSSLRVAQANNDKNAKTSPITHSSNSKTDKEKHKVHKTITNASAAKTYKDISKKDMSKEGATKIKSRTKPPLLEAKDNSNTHKSTNNSTVSTGIIKDARGKSNKTIGDLKIDDIKSDNTDEMLNEENDSSQNSQENAPSIVSYEHMNDDETQSSTSSTIKSVLKKQRTKNDKGEKRPKAPKKTVQFGPKMVKEVTKIVYPWNESHSSSDEEATNDENTDEDDDDEEDDDDGSSSDD